MTTEVLEAGESSVRQGCDWAHEESLGVDLPKGHVGPVLLSETGRTVWWTGRVAIGLRYEPPRRSDPLGESALWLQRVLLRCA